ncbi:MAG: 7-carboxy-7-deazaguanine synthase QueE [Bacteroidales bacterium]|nr:7-carboxy-7-deazaguanine synthase QueE [Bacteroidales bacterium]
MNQTEAYNPDDLSAGLVLPLMEDFYSLQGEGYHTGKAAYFIRIGGCDVGCHWCDVKESWDSRIWPPTSVMDILDRMGNNPSHTVVVTGGEPLMYNLAVLCDVLKKSGLSLHLETSGAWPLSGTWDWICLSPKKFRPPFPELIDQADELKIIVQDRSDIDWAEKMANRVREGCHLFLQPEWSCRETVMPMIIGYIKEHPQWRMSLQSHKYMKIP